jgi:hypothetical protein
LNLEELEERRGYVDEDVYKIQAQASVKMILDLLIFNTSRKTIEGSLLTFLKQLVTPLQFLPKDYLFSFEKARLNLDSHGRIL